MWQGSKYAFDKDRQSDTLEAKWKLIKSLCKMKEGEIYKQVTIHLFKRVQKK